MCFWKRKSKRFVNPHAEEDHRSLFDVLLWKMGYYDDPLPTLSPPNDFVYPLPLRKLDPREPKFMWINHSSFLIEFEGVRFLTDPIWNERCSPLSFIGPKRRHPPGIQMVDLPQIDCVLISHNHYDHLDKHSVLELYRRFPDILWLVPKGVKSWFAKRGISHVVELSWWQEITWEKNGLHIRTTAVPAQHFSGRKISDFDQTLWVGYVVECQRKHKQSKRFYFVGDTGYNPYDFKKVGMTWSQIDLSMIPIGCHVPRKFMAAVHIDPAEAVKIHKEVHSVLSVGMHWKTFHLSDEPMDQPPFALLSILQKEGIDPSSFIVVEPGHENNW